jgi:hypothetical protein
MLKFHTKPSGQIVKIDLRSVHILHFIEEIINTKRQRHEETKNNHSVPLCQTMEKLVIKKKTRRLEVKKKEP